MPHRVFVLLLTITSLAAGTPALATSYVMVDDATLVDQAAAVVDARIVSVEPAPSAAHPATDFTVEVERLLGGSVAGSTLVVRVPGGLRPDGVGFRVHGAPRFVQGERAILFLVPGSEGTFGLLHLGLGAFHRVGSADEAVALRNLSGAAEVILPGAEPDPRRHRARDYDGFAAWLTDRAAGVERRADYFRVEAPEGVPSLSSRFTLFEDSGYNFRWFEFDDGSSVPWLAHVGGQPSLSGGGFAEFQTALDAWNEEACTPLDLG